MIVDLIIVLILAICVFLGYKKGFIATFFNMFAGLICFAVSALIARPVGRLLSKVFIRPICYDYFDNAFRKFLDSSDDFANVKDAYSSVLEFFGRFGIKDQELQSLAENSENSVESFVDKAIEAVSVPIADAIGFIIAFVVILILVSILYKFFVKFLDLVSKFPLLNVPNKALGVACGFAHGIILSFAFSVVLFYIEPLFPDSGLDFSIENTLLARIFTSFLK